MMRGTFANIRLRNELAPGTEGGWTTRKPGEKPVTIYDAAMEYQKAGIPLVIIAGKEYGTGSSRDWAAKGTLLLGVRAVIAESFERIHRSNLVGMGVLPLEFMPGETRQTLGLTGFETFEIEGMSDDMKPRATVTVRARARRRSEKKLQGGLADRHAGGDELLPSRRDSAVRAQAARGTVCGYRARQNAGVRTVEAADSGSEFQRLSGHSQSDATQLQPVTFSQLAPASTGHLPVIAS